MVGQAIRRNKCLGTLLLGLVLINNIGCAKNTSLTYQEHLKSSPQFHDGKFHNKIEGLYDAGAAWRASLKEILLSNRVDPIPEQPPLIQQFTGRDFYKNSDESLRFSRLGHSTILLQIGEKVWLTDPVFSERVSLVQWIGPKRFHPVPISLEELPPIEGVLISHNHYDHLDHDSIVQIKDRVKHFYVPLGLGEILVSWGVRLDKISELDWWENRQIENVELVSTPAQHFSGRGLFDSDETLWTSWVIRTAQHSVYISGDSGYFEGFREIGKKYGPFDLAFLECGAYHESWRTMHMMPEDNLKAVKDLKGRILVPIHNGTFNLAFHSWYEPMEKIMKLTRREQIQSVIPLMGQIIDIINIPKTVQWWKPSAISL
ncbi:MAG: MBL fold metallo-hydrolase [bacterium]